MADRRRTKTPTLVDVARHAGVSLKTASRVLNNEPDVSAETAARVRAVMEKLDFRPNLLARGLKTRTSLAIGMIVPDISDPFAAVAIHAVMQIARRQDHNVLLTCSEASAEIEQAQIEMMLSRQVDGLIVMPADQRSEFLRSLQVRNLPIIAFDQPIANDAITSVTVANRSGARGAVEHLLSHGYKRILAVGAKHHLYTISRRLHGYREALAGAGRAPIELLVATEDGITSQALEPFLTGPARVHAIFTLNSVATVRVLQGLRDHRLEPPRDIALACFDDFELASVLSPSLTVVRQPVAMLGSKSAELLFNHKGRQRASRLMLPTELIVRTSCGCPPSC